MNVEFPRGLTLAYGIIKFVCFVALAVHIGWSWWLLALVVSGLEVEFN